MRRLIPHPVLSLALLLMWLLLTRFSVGQALLGAAVSLFAGWALSSIEPRGPRLRRPWMAAILLGRVCKDILISNILVARRILRGPRPEAPPGFLRIQLRLREPGALAMLALILTATPGSAWIAFDSESGELLLHILEQDGTDWAALIHDRYESLLMEIFA